MAANRPIRITILGNSAGARGAINGVAGALLGLGRTSRTIDRLINRSALVAGGALAFGIAKTGSEVVKMYNSIQKAGVSFTYLFGTAKKAKIVLDEVKQIAKTTQFPVDKLTDYAKRLGGAGTQAKDVGKQLRTILDLTSAYSLGNDEAGRAVLALTQIQARGTVQLEEINQLVDAGIPAQKLFADALGITSAEFRSLTQKGAVPAGEALDKLFALVNRDYAGAAVRQAATLSGGFTKLKSNVLSALVEGFTPLGDYIATQLPALIPKVVGFVDRGIVPAMKRMPEVLIAAKDAVVDFVTGFNSSFKGLTGATVPQALQDIFKTAKDFATAVKNTPDLDKYVTAILAARVAFLLYTKAAALASAATVVLNGTITRAKFVSGLLTGVGLLAAAFGGLIAKEKAAGAGATTWGEATVSAGDQAKRAVEIAFFGFVSAGSIALAALVGIVRAGGALMANGILSALQTAVDGILALLKKLPDNLVPDGLLEGLEDFANKKGLDVGKEFAAGIDSSLEFTKPTLDRFQQELKQGLSTDQDFARQQGAKVVQTFGQGLGVLAPIKEGAPKLLSTAKAGVGNTGGLLTAQGSSATYGFSKGLGATAPVTAAGGAVRKSAERGVGDTGNLLKPAGTKAGVGMATGLTSTKGQVTAAASGLGTGAAASAGGAQSAFVALGNRLGQGLAAGLRAQFSNVQIAASLLAQEAAQAARAAAQVRSPSRVFMEIGRFMAQGLIVGLLGDRDSVRSAAIQLSNLVTESFQTFIETRRDLRSDRRDAKADIDDARQALKEAHAQSAKTKAQRKDKAKDVAEATAEYRKALKDYGKVQQQLTNLDKAYAKLNTKGEVARVQKLIAGTLKALDKLATKREEVAAKLEIANGALSDAISARDSFISQLQGQALDFASLANLDFGKDAEGNANKATTGGIVEGLATRLAAIKDFTKNVQLLATQGLGNDSLQQILELGPQAGSEFARALLQGGADGIKSVNLLQGQITAASTELADFGGKKLFQAGVDSAAKLVQGLEAQEAALKSTADKLAEAFNKAFSDRLGVSAGGLNAVEALIARLELAEAKASPASKVPPGSTTGAPPPNQIYHATLTVKGADPASQGGQVLEQIAAYTALYGPAVIKVAQPA